MIYSFVCTYSVNVRNFLELHIARYISFSNLRCILGLAHIYKTSFRLVRRLDNTITFGTWHQGTHINRSSGAQKVINKTGGLKKPEVSGSKCLYEMLFLICKFIGN